MSPVLLMFVVYVEYLQYADFIMKNNAYQMIFTNLEIHSQFTKTELYLGSLYICAWFGLVIDLMTAFLKNALTCIFL